MRTQPTSAKIASAWERMVANVNTTMRIRRAPDPPPESLKSLESLSSRENTSSMAGPVLLAIVFWSFAFLCLSLAAVWEHQQQQQQAYFFFTWLAILCGVAGGAIIFLAVVGILGDK